MRFELHCHSTCSDGSDSPERVGALAVERGVEVLALTDHDTCAGSERAAVAAGGIRTIRAVEVTCVDDAGRTVHVLAYRRPEATAWERLEDRLAAVREARMHRLRVMATKLEMRGIALDVEPLLAEARHRAVGRPDLARAMVAAGAATSFKDAFARHLYDHGPVDVPLRALTLGETLALGREAGAAMSLAHPHLYDDRSAAMLKTHRANGLEGIEAFHGAYDTRERSRWLAVADRLALVCTGGSDWHGDGDGDGGELGVDLPPDRAEALLAWLA